MRRARTSAPPTPTDLHTLLACERTPLAWVRTGLGLIGFGFLMAKLDFRLGLVSGKRGPRGIGWFGAARAVSTALRP